ncbi:tRNA/rRNA methyltransferase [Candidatus Symbiopectobacterium sp.]|uniref:tRNA/rRNA methyltransferase n=1 Tax=Candidatus Symbiopectobacterium sp. TaxID=2816440 RepID=UPI0025C2F70A|nr:tRNA/rRNA methyltransferase [Candidatus Symbiopectobacterium sp.]
MSDSAGSKSGKVRIMYVRNEDEKKNSRTGDGARDRRNDNEKTGRRDNRDKDGRTKPRDPRDMNPRYVRENPHRNNDNAGRDDREDYGRGSDSPWKTVSRAPDAVETPDHGGIVGKSRLDPEQIRRQRQEETRVYGENACQALFTNRPDAIVRAWFLQEVTPRFREALRWMAANRKAYHVVDDEELTKASGTDHHGCVCFLIKKRQGSDVNDYLAQAQAKETDCVLALEDVGNPHNLGGIVRSCAHFGVEGVLIHDPSLLESGAAVRTAEGGAEHVNAIQTDSFPSALDAFRAAGYTIATTSSHKGQQLAQTALPKKVVLVVGHEGDGLTDSTWQQGDLPLSIGGTGKVESLNISVATGILLSEWWRQHSITEE